MEAYVSLESTCADIFHLSLTDILALVDMCCKLESAVAFPAAVVNLQSLSPSCQLSAM